MGFIQHKSKIVYEKILVVKSIHNTKDSLKKVWKLQIKISEFENMLLKKISFLCYLTLILFLCYLHLCYLVCDHSGKSSNVDCYSC